MREAMTGEWFPFIAWLVMWPVIGYAAWITGKTAAWLYSEIDDWAEGRK